MNWAAYILIGRAAVRCVVRAYQLGERREKAHAFAVVLVAVAEVWLISVAAR